MKLKTIPVLAFVLIFITANCWAGRYRQPAYVTNVYFTNKLITQNNIQRPDHIINIIRADHDTARGYFVLDLIVDKGTHFLSVELLDSQGKKFDNHDFHKAVADKHDYNISINLGYGGKLPAGGIFFKVFDRHDDTPRSNIGTFRIFSEQWN